MPAGEAPWRVYLAEWLIVYTSDQDGKPGQEECESHFALKYAGRVRDEHWRIIPAVTGAAGAAGPHCLQLMLPNLKGEYKDEDAFDVPWLAGDPRIVVRRGSSEEQALLDYGRKMLPQDGGGPA